jgi:hypothetical protein
MTVAQGIQKLTVLKKQTGLGVPAVGAGGQVLRRKTSIGKKSRATYTNDEIVQHQQSTGVNLGTASTSWDFDGLLSPGTYAAPLAGLLRKAFVAGVSTTAAAITIAVGAPVGTIATYTVTRGTGSYLADGVKVGDMVTLGGGTFNVANAGNNLLVIGLNATVANVVTLNGSALVAEGPIAGGVMTVAGKKTMAPTTGHTDDLFTVEEWYADISKSEVFPDIRIGQCDIGLPASGNATIKLASQGLGVRTRGNAQVLTAPTPATATPVLTAVRGVVLANGVPQLGVTSISLTIKGNLNAIGPVVGSNFNPDMSRGRVEVTGTFSALFDSTTLGTLYDNETVTSLVAVMAADTTNGAGFVAINLSAIKLTDDAPDDGEKAVMRTYPFTAQINAAGGPALPSDMTIVSIQDSAA